MNRSMTVLNTCLEYIEENIKERLSLDNIAEAVGNSKYHLHRMFKNLTGTTLSEYVRARKLSLSLEDLFSKNYRIVDVAIEYGFEYEQNYIRSFKRQFNTTPLKAKQEKKELRIIEPYQLNEFTEIQDALIYKPFYVVKKEMILVGVKHRMKDNEDDSSATSYGCDFFYNRRQEINNIVNRDHYYGYTYWEKGDTGYNYYLPSMLVNSLKEIPKDMVSVVIPQNKYAVFKLVGFFEPEEIKGSDLDPIMGYMYGKWIDEMGYEMAGDYRIEFIDKGISKEHYCELFLYIPIKFKKELY